MARVETHDGRTLHAEAHGDGIPVVLSCGLCTTSENWRANVAPLVAGGLRVILWDYRGHGRSDAPDDPSAYTLGHVVDDLSRVIAWASPEGPAVVGGLSFGGLASLHLALARPELVRALLLIDTGPGFKNPKAQARWQAMVERTATMAETKGMRAFVESKASATAIGLYPERDAQRAAADAIADQVPHGIAHFARNIAGPADPVIDELPSIDKPALVLVGERDEAYLAAADVMEARLPSASRATIPGAGHLVNLDEPAAFEAAVLDFVKGLA